MGILDEDVVRVRESTDLVALVTQYTQLRKVGSRWVGLCPFHSEKSPSFSVNSEAGLYHCFGCQVSGDAITFLREKEQLDFVGAVERLATRAGITLRYTDPAAGQQRQRSHHLREVLEAAAVWYHERLLSGADAGAARSYLRGRGFSSEEVVRYRIGWAPSGWDELCRGLGLSRVDAVDTGLGLVNRRDRLQDFFRSRILFPIADDQGRIVAFGGRKLPDGEGPKYQNSREHALYVKSRVLYGLNWAKADAVAVGEMVVCEGYTDVIGFHRAGIARAVATCGTSLTEDHLKVIKRYAPRVVLAYDADAAGQAAAERIYAWERSLGLEVAVVRLPEGSDPDEMARLDPAGLSAAVAAAESLLAFRLDRVLGAADLATPESRVRAARGALAVVAEHPDPMVREPYLLRVAAQCRLPEQQLRSELDGLLRSEREGPTRPGRPAGGGEEPLPAGWEEAEAGAGPRGDRGSRPGGGGAGDAPSTRREGGRSEAPSELELEGIRHLIADRTSLGSAGPFVLFSHPVMVRLAVALASGVDLAALAAGEDRPVSEWVHRLAQSEPASGAEDALMRLVARSVERAETQVRTEAAASGDPLAWSALLRWLVERRQELRGWPDEDGDTARESCEALLAWLAEREGPAGGETSAGQDTTIPETPPGESSS